MTDFKNIVNNHKLLQAINAMYEQATPFTKSNVYKLITESTFIAPVIINRSPIKSVKPLADETEINFALIEGIDQKMYLPAFTDSNELSKWKDINTKQTVLTTFDEYCELVFDVLKDVDGVVINPYGKSVALSRKSLESLKTQHDKRKRGIETVFTAQGSKLEIGEPRIFPFDIAKAICDYSATNDGVKALYLKLATAETGLCYFIIADLSPDCDRNTLSTEINNAVDNLIEDIPCRLLDIDTQFGKDCVRDSKPFYSNP